MDGKKQMLKVITLFTGIGAQEAALKRLGLDFEMVGISEIDKYAIQSYEAINGPTRNYGDITQIERLDYADLWTYSSPCQDFSTAGKQKGIYNADGSLTRSGLLLHVERLLTESVLYGTQPKYLLLENVKALVSKKFMPDFQRWLDKLEQLGYNNYWQILNAKDYGIPQNRERVFVVSIRKDVDTKGYKFPSPVPLEKRLKDMLEPCVDEKYYLSADKVEKFLQNGNTNPSGKGMNGNVCTGDICNTLTTNKGEGLKIKEVSNTIRCGGGSLDGKHTWDVVVEPQVLTPKRTEYGKQIRKDYESGLISESRHNMTSTEPRKDGINNTLTTVQKDNYVVEPMAYDEQNGYIRKDGCVGTLTTDGSSPKHNNRVIEPQVIQLGNIVNTGNWDNPQRGRIYSPSGISPALNTVGGGGLEPKILEEGIGYHPFNKREFRGFNPNYSVTLLATDYKNPCCYSNGYRIRKLTPKECWRLMGFTDIEFECAQISGVSNSRLYQQAGNSIVVDVLVGIFRNLFTNSNKNTTIQIQQLKIGV